MTRRDLFARMGGLDTAYSPGYFEDLDYCVRLWRAGWRIVFLPDVALLHYENASSPRRDELYRLYQRNHFYFTQKHADWLGWQCPSSTPRLWARGSHDDRFKILYLPRWKSASTATESLSAIAQVVRRLRSSNCFVSVYPIDAQAPVSRGEMPDLPADVEVLRGGSLDTLPDFLAERWDYYDGVAASDTAIVERLKECVRQADNAA